MSDESLIPLSFPAVASKKITAAFAGARITSDVGVMLLAQAEGRLGIADKFAAVIADPRNPKETKSRTNVRALNKTGEAYAEATQRLHTRYTGANKASAEHANPLRFVQDCSFKQSVTKGSDRR